MEEATLRALRRNTGKLRLLEEKVNMVDIEAGSIAVARPAFAHSTAPRASSHTQKKSASSAYAAKASVMSFSYRR